MATRSEIFVVRLIILIIAICVPLYFLILALLIPTDVIPLLDNDFLNRIISTLLMITYFSLPIEIFIYLKRYKIANTLMNLRRNTILIPLKWRIFYGFNALVITLFFVLPFAAPILSIIAIIVISGRFVGKIYHPDFHNKAISILIFLVITVILEIPAIFFAYQFIPNYIPIATLILGLWFVNVYVIATLSILLVDVLTIGSIIEFIFYYTIEKELESIGVIVSQIPVKKILIFEGILFTGISYMWLTQIQYFDVFLTYLNTFCLLAVGILFLIGMATGIKKRKIDSNLAGLLFAAAFSAVYIFEQLNKNAITIAYATTFVLFLILFLFSYRQAEDY